MVTERMYAHYPNAVCALEYQKPHELLIATRLSAQCKDERVNLVTPRLFAKYPTIDAFAQADPADVSEIIRSLGLYQTKARDIVGICRMLRDDFGGVVPDNIEDLLKLPGVGRKTANLVVGDIYGKSAVVTDTHCIRICGRLGLTDSKDPLKVENQLRALLDPEKSNGLCHRLVWFGRETCMARAPRCGDCFLSDICPAAQLDGKRG